MLHGMAIWMLFMTYEHMVFIVPTVELMVLQEMVI